MRLLVDSHVLLWWLSADPSMSTEAYRQLRHPANDVLVSAVSSWELAIKQAKGKLSLPDRIEEIIAREAFISLPVTIRHGFAAGALPPHHKDPFDRMLIAQAQLEGLTLVTRDPEIAAYDVARLLA